VKVCVCVCIGFSSGIYQTARAMRERAAAPDLIHGIHNDSISPPNVIDEGTPRARSKAYFAHGAVFRVDGDLVLSDSTYT